MLIQNSVSFKLCLGFDQLLREISRIRSSTGEGALATVSAHIFSQAYVFGFCMSLSVRSFS